ncbi:MAG: hypothetical protein KAX05_01805 [Bacteroidales bacterium]|nr:hypothetical protein [Bacteroidales bacterium]
MNKIKKNTKSKYFNIFHGFLAITTGLVLLITLNSCSNEGGNSNSDKSIVQADSISKPPENILNKHSVQTTFTDPGKFAYLYDDLPKSIKKNCDIIKRQLIYPMEAANMPKVFPKDKLPEDGDFPIVSDMLRELVQRNNEGLIMNRLPKNRLLVACYHHGLLLASILRSQGKSVRLRAGFARYYENQMNIRFSHVVCEVWNADKERWEIIDPDRNFQNVSYDKFEFPAEVWHNYINDNLPNVKYFGSIGQGDNVYIHSLLLDMAFILGNERNYWHTPDFIFKKDFDINNLKKEQIQVLNQIANLMNDPANNFKQLEKLYNENPFIQTHERTIDNYYERNYD